MDAVSNALAPYRRLTVKIGSATIVDGTTGRVRTEWLGALAEDLAALHKAGVSVVACPEPSPWIDPDRVTAAKQLEHWARFGMYFDRQSSTSRRRIQRAVAGETPLGDLGDEERVVANAAINAAISTAANEVPFADRLAARGVTTVVMDDEGRMVRRHPDGSTTVL